MFPREVKIIFICTGLSGWCNEHSKGLILCQLIKNLPIFTLVHIYNAAGLGHHDTNNPPSHRCRESVGVWCSDTLTWLEQIVCTPGTTSKFRK